MQRTIQLALTLALSNAVQITSEQAGVNLQGHPQFHTSYDTASQIASEEVANLETPLQFHPSYEAASQIASEGGQPTFYNERGPGASGWADHQQQ